MGAHERGAGRGRSPYRLEGITSIGSWRLEADLAMGSIAVGFVGGAAAAAKICRHDAVGGVAGARDDLHGALNLERPIGQGQDLQHPVAPGERRRFRRLGLSRRLKSRRPVAAVAERFLLRLPAAAEGGAQGWWL